MLSIANLLDALLDLLLLGAISFLGALLVLSLSKRSDTGMIVVLAFPIGSFALTWTMFMLSWAGAHVALATWGILYLILLIGARKQIGALFQLPIFSLEHWKNYLTRDKSRFSLWLTVLLLLGLVSLLAVGRSYSTWDATGIWSAKGYGIALERTIFAGQSWGAHGLSYPLHIPLLISIFESVHGDPLPGSKLIFPMFFLAMLLGAYQYWRNGRSNSQRAIVGMLLIGTTPIVFGHATTGYANLPFTCYLVLAVLQGLEALKTGSNRDLSLCSFLFAAASWTRPEGFFLSLFALGTIWASGRFIHRRSLSIRSLSVPFLMMVVPWIFFISYHGINAQIPSQAIAALKEISQGHLNLSGFLGVIEFFFSQTIEIKTWGLLYPLTTLLILFNLYKFHPKSGISVMPLFLVTLVLCLSVVSLYYLTSFSSLGLDWWLASGFDRMLMPTSVLYGVLGIHLFASRESQKIQGSTS